MFRRAIAMAAFVVPLGCLTGGTASQDESTDGATGATRDGTSVCAEACDDGGGGSTTGSGGVEPADSTGVVGSSGDETGAEGTVTIRVATWNILRVGAPGSEQFEALAAIVMRLDADVLCVQEVGEGEAPQLQALSKIGGYDYGLLTPAAGPDGAGIANACMSRLPTIDAAYLWSDWISSDPSARDLTRPFVRLRLQHETSGRTLSVISGHLKAGGDEVDRFRRMVESIRLAQATEEERAQDPDTAVVVLGDFNDGPTPTGTTFNQLPDGLPGFYNLGNDIQLPIVYDPPSALMEAGLTRVEARWEDGTEEATFIPFESRLDYVYVLGGGVLASEVYEACRDDGVDDPPTGDVLAKVGEPLRCGTSELASDHRPVVVDFRLQ